jgi:REP element-mobilizing transposase RayT
VAIDNFIVSFSFSPMSQSLAGVFLHVIFSTKDRVPCLDLSFRPQLHAYLATVSREHNCECLRTGGVADHVHLAVRLSRTLAIAHLIEELKTSSSMWVKKQSPLLSGFSWQRGYGAFSVSPSHLKKLTDYIDNQEEHHRTKTFQEEFRMFLTKYEIQYDERYLWD